jgi:hypothetical protein
MASFEAVLAEILEVEEMIGMMVTFFLHLNFIIPNGLCRIHTAEPGVIELQ